MPGPTGCSRPHQRHVDKVFAKLSAPHWTMTLATRMAPEICKVPGELWPPAWKMAISSSDSARGPCKTIWQAPARQRISGQGRDRHYQVRPEAAVCHHQAHKMDPLTATIGAVVTQSWSCRCVFGRGGQDGDGVAQKMMGGHGPLLRAVACDMVCKPAGQPEVPIGALRGWCRPRPCGDTGPKQPGSASDAGLTGMNMFCSVLFCSILFCECEDDPGPCRCSRCNHHCGPVLLQGKAGPAIESSVQTASFWVGQYWSSRRTTSPSRHCPESRVGYFQPTTMQVRLSTMSRDITECGRECLVPPHSGHHVPGHRGHLLGWSTCNVLAMPSTP